MLAGYAFEFISTEDAPALFPRAYDPFICDAAAAVPAGRYEVLPPSAEGASWGLGDTVWLSETWRLCRTSDGGFALCLHILSCPRPLPVACFSADFGRGRLVRRAGRHGAPSPYAWNYPVDQATVANVLWPRGVGIVHAAAVDFGGRALLLCGKSGAGKTTLARLCRAAGAMLLNDDRQFVWAEGDRAMTAPTPWHGVEPEIRNTARPLAAILHLAHGKANTLESMAGARAAAALLGNAVVPYYNKDAVASALQWAAHVIERVPSYGLAFTADESSARLCGEIAAGAAAAAMPRVL